MAGMDEPRKSSREGRPEIDPIASQLQELAAAIFQFEKYLAHFLSVNSTDLSAMEHLIGDGPLTPSELARRLDISTAAATVMVDRLVALGHVHRRPHERDRRMVDIVPSPPSVQAAHDAMRPMLTGIAEATSALNERDRKVVERFLTDVIGAFRPAT